MFKFAAWRLQSEPSRRSVAQDPSIQCGAGGGGTSARHSRFGCLAVLFVAPLAVSLTTVPAFAVDYTVAYALEVDGKTETGKIENCNSVDACRIKFRTMDASADLYFPKSAGDEKIVLSIWGDSACCYFSDGAEQISLDPAKPLHTVTIYAGHARRRNEVIRNQALGVLYLSFVPSR